MDWEIDMDIRQWETEPLPVQVPDCDLGDGVVRTDEQMRTYAEAVGCEIRTATARELFVDLDSDAAWQTFLTNFPVVGEHFCPGPGNAARSWEANSVVTPSKSGLPKRHAVVTLAEDQPELVRIALQAALGSDGRREAISVLRSLRGEPNVVVFFEPKEKKS